MTRCADPPAAAAVRPPLVLSATTFVSAFDRFAVSPMLVPIAHGLGVPLGSAVLVASGYFLAYGLCQPVWGLLSDRFGRVRLIRLALVGGAVAGVLSALAPTLPVLVVARVAAGACFGAIIPTSLTYVGDTVVPTNRQRALTDLMAAMATGTTLATAVAGVLAHLLDWRVVFATPALFAVVCSVALRRLAEPARAPVAGLGAHLGAVLRNRWAVLVFLLAFVEGAVLLGTMTLLAAALQSQGVSAAVAGLATAGYGLGVVSFSRVVKVLARRLPVWSLIAIGGAQICLGYAVVASSVGLVTVVVTALLLGGGWSFMHSSLQTWATSVVPQARGAAVSFFAAALFVGSSVAAYAGGPLADAGRFGLLFAVASVLTVPLTLTAATTRRRWREPAP